jgi:hypothetical protein
MSLLFSVQKGHQKWAENRRVNKNEQKTEGSPIMSRKQKGHQKWAENRRVINNE